MEGTYSSVYLIEFHYWSLNWVDSLLLLFWSALHTYKTMVIFKKKLINLKTNTFFLLVNDSELTI